MVARVRNCPRNCARRARGPTKPLGIHPGKAGPQSVTTRKSGDLPLRVVPPFHPGCDETSVSVRGDAPSERVVACGACAFHRQSIRPIRVDCAPVLSAWG